MNNSLTITNDINSNHNFKLVLSANSLDIPYTIHFTRNNLDWIDDNSFVIYGDSLNCVFECKIYKKDNGLNAYVKLYIGENNLGGYVNRTIVTVLAISENELNILNSFKIFR